MFGINDERVRSKIDKRLDDVILGKLWGAF